MTPRFPHALVAPLLAAAGAAQSFTYPDFSNVGTLQLLGNAAQNGTALRLTASTLNQQTSWAWHRTQMPVINGFKTTFTFRITPLTNGVLGEGVALVIHDDPNGLATVGGTDWGIGYGNGSNGAVGIRNSIAIELDTFRDTALGDTSSNELSIHTRGSSGNHEDEQYSIGRATPATVLSDGQVHSLRVTYVPGTIAVVVDNAAPAITRAFSLLTGGQYQNGQPALPPPLPTGGAWAGFCASTGGGTLTEQVEILSWTWASTPLDDPCYAGTVGEDVLLVEGSAGGPLRQLDLVTFQPLSIEMRAPAISGPGLPWVLIASLQPNPGAPGTSLGFGNMCMPVAPLGPTELIFADAFGVFSALVVAGPTPFTIPVPPSAITFDLDVTLQGVLALQPGAASFGISNAIDLRFRRAPAPTITSVAPLSAAAGQPITVTGTQFLPGSTLLVNGTAVAPTSSSATQIVFPYPAGVPCNASVSVVRLDGQSANSALNPTPAVTSTALSSGTAAGNQLFLVNGTGFIAGTTVTIGGAAAIVQSVSATALLLRTPPGTPGVAAVVITTPGGCQAQTTYTYL